MDKKIVVAHSGGLDSTVLLYVLQHRYSVKKENLRVIPVHFNYGQKHVREVQAANKLCDMLQLCSVNLTIPNLHGGCLVDKSNVPNGKYDDILMRQTVVPARNLVFISMLTNYALAMGAEEIALGVHQGDHAIYPDCRPKFIIAMERVLKVVHYTPCKLYTPFLAMTKTEIVKIGIDYKVPFDKTWTCCKGGDVHCGTCGSCNERKEAFALCNAQKLDVEYKA